MIRSAHVQDAPAIAEIYLAARKKHVPFAPLAHGDDEVRIWVRDVLLSMEGVHVYIEDEGIVAFISISRRESFSWIDQLYVSPEFIGKRYGSRLVAFAKKVLASPIRLYTFQQNELAQKFYEKAGFRAIAYSDGAENEERCPDVLMEWQTKPA